MTATNIALAKMLYRALENGDAPALMGLLHAEFHGMATEGLPEDLGGSYHGPKAMFGLWKKVARLFSVRPEPAEFLQTEDGRVVVLGRYVGPRMNASFAHIIGFRDGKIRALQQITDSRRWFDALRAAPQDKPGINGVAHVMLTVRSMQASRAFYMPFLEQMGLTKVVDDPAYLYYIGGRTAVGLRPAAPEFAEAPFEQGRAGLHHVCFRARSREDVDAVHALVERLGARVVHPPEEGDWVPGYYSVLFEDPDGIRLEVNHVPGRGVLDGAVARRS